MSDLNLTCKYEPKGKQALFHQSTEDDVYFGGAKGPGKTTAMGMDVFLYAWEHVGSDPHIFRETYESLEAGVIKEILEWIPRECFEYNQTKHEMYLLNEKGKKRGSTIKFRQVANLNEAREYDGRSIPYLGVDELGKFDQETIQILRSCNRSTKYPVFFRATGNPGGKGHKFVRDRYVHPTEYGKKTYTDPKTGQEVRFIPANVYDGVLTEKDPGYVRRLEDLPEKERQAYLFGNYDIFDGMFFEEFGPHLKISPHPLPEGAVLYGSLDHGETAPTSFGLWWINGMKRPERIWTYYYPYHKDTNPGQEKRSTKEHAYEIARAIQSLPYAYGRPPRYVWADPSMWTKKRLEENFQPSAIDYYVEAFNEVFKVFYDRNRSYGKTEFVRANNDRRARCPIMREHFKCTDGVPNSFYWNTRANAPYEEFIPLQQHDDKNPEVYDTSLEDHIADDTGYFFMGIRGIRALSEMKMEDIGPWMKGKEMERARYKSPYEKRYEHLLRSPALC